MDQYAGLDKQTPQLISLHLKSKYKDIPQLMLVNNNADLAYFDRAYTSTLSAEEYNKLMENLNDDDYMEEFIGKANLEITKPINVYVSIPNLEKIEASSASPELVFNAVEIS